MALGISIVKSVNIKQAGGFRFRVVDLTYDATYAAGGYAITPADLSLSGIVYISPGVAGDTAFVTKWNEVTGKIMVGKTGAALSGPFAEAGVNQASLTGLKSRHFVIGY